MCNCIFCITFGTAEEHEHLDDENESGTNSDGEQDEPDFWSSWEECLSAEASIAGSEVY